MTTLDDKLLGEKTHYYCSSDEDEGEDKDAGDDNEDEVGVNGRREPVTQSCPPTQSWSGYSQNTGPKGVITDFQKFKQLEAEKRLIDESRTLQLAQQLSLSSQSQDVDQELESLVSDSDPILQEYMRKRMEEMRSRSQEQPVFGQLIRCSDGTHFLREVEQDVKVIVHLYASRLRECHRMNDCFQELAVRHENTKFVSVEVNSCGMSARFEEKGCPSILVYKKGSLIGTFITVTDELGSRFDVDDVESLLLDHGFLSDRK